MSRAIRFMILGRSCATRGSRIEPLPTTGSAMPRDAAPGLQLSPRPRSSGPAALSRAIGSGDVGDMALRSRIVVAVVGLGLLATGCGGSTAGSTTTRPALTSTTSATSTTSVGETTAPEPTAISVEELFDGEGSREAIVEGFVLVDPASTRLCATLLESYPAQCGWAWVVIANPGGLDVELDETEGIAWTPSPVRVEGFYDGNRLIVQGGPEATPTEEDEELIEAFTSFAATGDGFDDITFAPEVGLGLADRIVRSVPASVLADRTTWEIDDHGFRARTGPFSALELATGEVAITAGSHAHCASPPVAAPTGFADHRRLSIQPTSATSCLEWSTVDLFIDADGNIAAVTLDLFEP